MLFALADYLNYKRCRGRFGRDLTESIMGGAFQGLLPETALQVLRPGDVLFVQTRGWFLSWIIMYLTRSEVSHVAVYIGDGQIAHSTLSGVSVDKIESLFDPHTRILPCVWPMPDETRALFVRTIQEQYQGAPYGWYSALLKGFRIVTGRDWPYFRWKFFIDVSLTLLLMDVPLYLFVGHPVITWLVPVYFAVIIFNCALWRVRPLKFSEWTGKPCDLLSMLKARGGSFLFDAYEVQQQVNKRRDRIKDAVRGKYYKRYLEGTNVIVLDPDVAKQFKDSDSVNKALRTYLKSEKRGLTTRSTRPRAKSPRAG